MQEAKSKKLEIDQDGLPDRLVVARHESGVALEEWADLLKVKDNTLKGSVYGKQVTPAYLLQAMIRQHGFDGHWLLTGIGDHYFSNRQPVISYSGNGVAVHTNHGNIGVGEASTDTGGRGLRLCDFVQWWMDTHSADDQAWLESQIARAVPEYADWKKGSGR
ncbi:MAG: hypothetical protein BWK73_49780 [Thiothrix lacustris]|uniref:Uncharacterized protein n=1 Tax=Thiothrix lacustris TaxID=525917 RepID=A0A1Y1Q8U0_9GAMM|nr:MAG: hypothetical protein BWK73_49780 [Thiothrix lacustris]